VATDSSIRVCLLLLFLNFFSSLTGRVTYSHRGPTMRRAFDRADLLLEVGSTNDLQSIGIYGYDGCAQILEPARQNNVIF